MDKHRKKELSEYIDRAFEKLRIITQLGHDEESMQDCLSSIIDALYLIRSELKDDK